MEISTDVIVAIIGFIGIITTQVFTSKRKETLLEAQLYGFKTEVNIKIDNLARDVQKHNNVIERTYELEKQVEILKERCDNYE